MNEAALIDALRKIREVVDGALARAGTVVTPSKRKVSPKKKDSAQAVDGLSGHILRLRDSGFLKQPKTGSEVHTKLQPEYPCDVNRVAVALFRLRKKGLLRKASKVNGKTKQVAYVW
jgi:hypothetical protein